jgi:PAS domain S-box-containing protein
MRKTQNISEKKQARIILITGMVSFILGSITDVVLPELHVYVPTLASVIIIIWAMGLTYAITKYGLMTITPAAAAEDILATMADSLILINPDRDIIRTNQATLDLLGFKEKELIGKPIDAILNERSLFRGEEFQRLIRDGQRKDYDMDYKTKSGELIPISFSASVMYNKQRQIIGIVGVAKDLRQIRRLIKELQEERAVLDIRVKQRTAELEKANRELEEKTEELKEKQVQLIQSAKMAAVGQLGAGVAHELNNPLGGILGYAQFILEKLKRPEFGTEDFKGCSKYLESIEHEAARCKGIVENLLKFSRRPIVAKPEPLDIKEALEETLSIIGHQLKLKNINLVLDIQPNLAGVLGIINQLQQVFANLILNAQQAMSEAGELKITAYNILDEKIKTPSHVRIEFADTGCGISKENLVHLFEPFFTTKQKEKGTGLGLAVSYQIIQDHKGTLEVTSQVGKGTVVAITLPTGGKS